VQLVKATTQKWSGGAAGAGFGYNHTIYLLAKDKKNIRPDSLWINSYRLEAKVDEGSSKGDTLVVIVTEYHSTINKEAQKALQPAAKPKGVTGDAVLGYFVNGKRMYLSIQELKKLKDLNYE
jgi:hypothetical protein